MMKRTFTKAATAVATAFLSISVACGEDTTANVKEPQTDPTLELQSLETGVPMKKDKWMIDAETFLLNYGYAHDALQHRTDDDEDGNNDWSSSDSSGDGYGIRFTVSWDGEGSALLTFQSSETTYDDTDEAGGSHQINNDLFNGQIEWQQVTDTGKDWHRGWKAGLRYLSEDKDVSITEAYGRTVRSFDASTSWKLVSGGYFFDWRPFGRWVRVICEAGALFGDVEGDCREGRDESWTDGRISEEYQEADSLAYGANVGMTVYADIHPRVSLGVGYRREWLYSFDATDSGMAMYPDNNDALFISNGDYVTANLVLRF